MQIVSARPPKIQSLHLDATQSVRVYGTSFVSESAIIGNFVVIGFPKEASLRNGNDQLQIKDARVDAGAILGNFVVVGEGTFVGENAFFDDHVRVGFDCHVGSGSRIMYGAFVCDRVKIGENTKVAGFVCDAVRIGNDSTCMGTLVHKYSGPNLAWGEDEPAPTIGDRCVVGLGATIIGGVTVGSGSYIAAGAIVTRDVPEQSVVIGCNGIKPAKEWRGEGIDAGFWTWKGTM